jgi:GNAT superfamily N-acetyltransferase
VFRDDTGEYFNRYFEADPAFRDADCHVAAVDGRLVAAVLVCRRRMEWRGREILCGAIANVATREEFRRRGLSRALLARSIAAMEADGFAFSMLFTGTYGHYGALGWQQVAVPRLSVRRAREAPATLPTLRELPTGPIPSEATALYDSLPRRPLHMARPLEYFEGWTGRYWRSGEENALLLAGNQEALGYAVIRAQPRGNASWVHELRARDAAVEADLLEGAARWARQQGHELLNLGFLPQFGGAEAAAELGQLSREANDGMMLRSITLPPEEMGRVTEAYASGEAQYWWSDDF